MEISTKVKMKDLLDIERCEKRGLLVGLVNKKTKSWAIAVGLKSMVENLNFSNADLCTINDFLDKAIEDNYFVSHSEKQAELEGITKNFLRYLDHEQTLCRQILDRNVMGNISLANNGYFSLCRLNF